MYFHIRQAYKDLAMKSFVSINTFQQLNIDARVKPASAGVTLNIIDKKDPDTWYTTFKRARVDNFATLLKHGARDFTASLHVRIRSQEELIFAQPQAASCDQVFDGILFAAGNKEVQKLKGASSVLSDKGVLVLTIAPSAFWNNENKSQNSQFGGKKLGFRFVIQDKQGEVFYSHDPMLIIPDWEAG